MSPIRFLMLVSLSLVLVLTPFFYYIGLPFVWLEAYLHEISHGLTAILSGGSVVSITLDFDGRGLCQYKAPVISLKKLIIFISYIGISIWGALIFFKVINSVRSAVRVALVLLLLMLVGLVWMRLKLGGWNTTIDDEQLEKIVLFFGYAGATIWGALIYSGALSSVRVAHRIALVIVILLLTFGFLWMKSEVESWTILMIMISLIFFPLWFVRYHTVQVFVQFIGIFIMTSNIYSVAKLFYIRTEGDHHKLSTLTGIPMDIWVWSWLIFCVAVLLFFGYKTFSHSKK